MFVVDPARPGDARRLAQGDELTGILERGDRTGAAVEVGDFDCDGRTDLAVGSPGEDLAAPFRDVGAVSVVFADGTDQAIFAGSTIDSYYMRPSDWVGAALASGDFDADGCDDLAIASPGADRSGGFDMGMVWLVEGSPDGLHAPVRLLQGIGLPGVLESRDQTGYAMATADFDCDGIDDLAVGAPREAIDGPAQGAVLVGYGSPGGLTPGDVLYQGAGLAGVPSTRAWVGVSIAGGDIDGDGCADLAVGAPGRTVGGARGAGAVLVTFGASGGLASSDRQFQLIAGRGLPGPGRAGDRMGAAVAIGDLDCDRRAELIVGVPGRDLGARADVGAVVIREGTRRGLGRDTATVRPGRGLAGKPSPGALVGASLVAASLGGDRCGDLVVGAPGTTVRGRSGAGAVYLVSGARADLSGVPGARLDQRRLPAGAPSDGAAFGGGSPLELLGRALRD